jgi:arsenate reductase (thioredoxin)
MFILGLQGSPRVKKSNTRYLLSAFMKQAESLGAQTHVVEVPDKNIVPCKEYIVCEKKGFCPIDDDMKHEIFGLIRKADVIVCATPIFFFNMTAQLKALVDRCQTFWGRKYRLKLRDPGSKTRQGYLLSVGATAGKQLFTGLDLTVKYFFDAVDARYSGSLTYGRIEHAGDMEKHATVNTDVAAAVTKVMAPYGGRKKVLFAGRSHACVSQMAAGWAQYLAGDRLDVVSGGSFPAAKVDAGMQATMAEKGIDMGFRNPGPLSEALAQGPPDVIVSVGDCTEIPISAGVEHHTWEGLGPAGHDMPVLRNCRDAVEKKVRELIHDLAMVK